MHIVHVMLSLDVGGLERNVLNQVRQTPRLGQQTTIICLERPGALAEQVRDLGANVICLNKRPGIRLGLIPRLKNVLEEIRPEVVHSHQLGTLFYAGPAARWAGVPIVVHTEHGQEKYAERMQTRILGRIAVWFADTFFCLTEDMAARVREHRIAPARKIRVIFNGIDTRQFMEPCDTAAARRVVGIPENVPVIGTVARLTEIKRQDVLIRAFAKVHARFPDAHLLLVGDGPLREELEKLAVSCGVKEQVHFAGYQSPTTPFVQLLTIFALPSRSEGMPQSAIEASVTGLAVVASRVGGLPELIDDGRTGLLVPVGDEGALAEALCGLLANPERARRMGQAARERAIARFDIARMADDYQRHFSQLLGQSPPAIRATAEAR
jgi:sugar transferase (PEP-CTERM/EpsH1 system associated)